MKLKSYQGLLMFDDTRVFTTGLVHGAQILIGLGGYMAASMLLGAMNKAAKMQPLNQKLARYGNEYGISRVKAHIS